METPSTPPTEVPEPREHRAARPRTWDPERIAVWVLLLAGLALRAQYLWAFSGSPLFDRAIGADVIEYHMRAREIADGYFFPLSPDIHAPLYSCFLALMLKLGAAIPAVRAVQLMLNFGAWLAFYWLLKTKRTPLKVRLGFLGIAMLAPVPVFYQSELVSESLLVPLAAAFFWLRHLAGTARTRGKRAGAFFGAGLALGAMNLTHPLTLFFSAAEVGWELVFRRDRRSAALLLAALAVTVGTFCAVQSAHYRKLCGIQANAGFNFYLGNNPAANGECYLRPGKRWRTVHRDAAQKAKKRGTSADAVFLREAGSFWLHHPGRALALWGLKAVKVSSPRELPSGSDLPPLLNFTSPVFCGRMFTPALFLLAAFGLWRIFRTRAVRCAHYLLFFFSMYLAQVVTVTSGRYRMAMIVPVALFAAVGIGDFNWRRYWSLPLLAAAVCGFLTVTDYGRMRAEAALLYAEAAMKRGDLRHADDLAGYAFRALDDPNPALCCEIRGDAALEHHREALAEGDYAGARRQLAVARGYFERMVAVEPAYYRGWMRLALLAGQSADGMAASDPGRAAKHYAAAENCYRRALKLEPTAADLCFNYALFRFRTGRPCEKAVADAVAAAPRSGRTWNLAGFSALRSGELRRALECFYRAAEFAPDAETREKYLNNLRHTEHRLIYGK